MTEQKLHKRSIRKNTKKTFEQYLCGNIIKKTVKNNIQILKKPKDSL